MPELRRPSVSHNVLKGVGLGGRLECGKQIKACSIFGKETDFFPQDFVIRNSFDYQNEAGLQKKTFAGVNP